MVGAISIPSGLFLEHRLRGRLTERFESSLWHHAQSGKLLIEAVGRLDNSEAQRLAARLAESTTARATVIAAGGTVLGDSKLVLAEVSRLENHADRPEFREAMAKGRGIARRYSTTLATDMLYVAVPYERADGRGVIRLATELAEITEAITQLRMLLAAAGALGLIMAVFVGALSSFLTSQRLYALVEHARAVALGEDRPPLTLPASDELGRIAGSFNQMAEELDRTVDTLARERHRVSAILESMSEAVIALDGGAQIELVNRAAMDMLDLTEQAVGRPLVEALQTPAIIECISGASTSEAQTVEFDLPGEQSQRLLASITPLPTTGGTLLVMHDVTEMRRLETVRRDFVANVSHELRTPVSVVQANAETLLDGALDNPEQAQRFVAAISRNALRLSAILADLLDLSRIEAGRYALELQPIDLVSPARRAMESAEKTALAKEVELTCSIPATVEVVADVTALDHVLINLVENAVKYTPSGGHVELRAVTGSGAIRLEVADDGPGIERRYRDRIFERFFRVDRGRSRQMGGTGLGLSIAKHLAEAMGGTIGVEPGQPKGSVFFVALPSTTSDGLTDRG
jgi:two-component system phosphate regulon sensor histidine kinase PhoR